MGSCNCCCKSTRCGKSRNNIKVIKESIQKSDIDNDNMHSIKPMLKASEDESLSDEDNTNAEEEEHISEMLLCDETIIELCPISLKIINILSIYHLFINKYTKENLSNNICEIISDKMNDYDLINLRNDYHHIITYHDSNNIFMKQLFNKLMIFNINNGINNLKSINNKLEIDENTNYHFGHLNDDEISMIQCLNQIHHDCTHKYINNNNNNSNNYINPNNNNYNNNNCDVSHEMQQMYNKSDAYQQCHEQTLTLINYNNLKNRNESNDTNSENEKENNEQICIDIDVKYSKDAKEIRKIGKLKLKQIKQKNNKKFDKTKVKSQTILNDDSWLNKDHKKKNKKSKHVISDSIQMLGNTKLVSNNRWKKSLNSLQENSSNNSFDLTSFDVNILEGDIDSQNDDEIMKQEEKRDIDIHIGYNTRYEIDRV